MWILNFKTILTTLSLALQMRISVTKRFGTREFRMRGLKWKAIRMQKALRKYYWLVIILLDQL